MRIGSQGAVDDGSANLQVDGQSAAAYRTFSPVTVAGSGSVTLSTPGFYYISAGGTSGAGDFTGSVPSAATYPGAFLCVVDTLGSFPFALTGSAYQTNKPVFSMLSASKASNNSAGTKLNVNASGSVCMFSDGFRWLITAGSGTFSLTGTP